MDINSKIKWTPGMPLSAQALNFFEGSFDKRKDAFVRAVLNSRTGILPGVDFSCNAMFVNNNLEVDIKNCMAWIPSGRLIDIESQKAVVPVPALSEGEFFLCAAFGDDMIEFESKGVPFEKPAYEYSIQASSAFESNMRFMPLLKLISADGNISIDKDYIVPHMQMGGDERVVLLTNELISKLNVLATHHNQDEEQRKLFTLYYQLSYIYLEDTTDTTEFVRFTSEIANELRCFQAGCGDIDEVKPSVYDLNKWFRWLFSLIEMSIEYLDGLVIEDKTIDYEELKRQITDDVYARITAENDEHLHAMHQMIQQDLSKQLEDSLRSFIEGEFKTALHDALHTEVSNELKESLYHSLYDALFNALFIPEKEEDVFTPMI